MGLFLIMDKRDGHYEQVEAEITSDTIHAMTVAGYIIERVEPVK